MKYFFILVFIFFCLFSFGEKTSLKGKVTDKETGEILIGATIYIPDFKTGTTTDTLGNYFLENLPQKKILLQINFVGYNTIIVTVDLTAVSQMDFAMQPSIKEIREIVITGFSQATEQHRTPIPIMVVPQITLLQNSSSNIIDAIATQPGVPQITTGSGISKPVIRGLGYNRVVVVNDGIRQEGQQWGDEHGIEIDEYSVNKVEILKGPGSIAYGSDAMAGVINMISAPTIPEGKVKGNVLGNYQSNNGLLGYSVNVAGNIKGFIWDFRYSNKMAHSYKNKYDGYVFNSGFWENNFGGIIGVNKSWGYAHLHLSSYNITPGIPEGERDSATGKFIKSIALNDSAETSEIVHEKDFKSYSPFVPFQKIHHYKIALNNSFVIGKGNLKTIFGVQQNQRLEFANILTPGDYGLYFHLNTFNYDVRYVLPEVNSWNVSFGVNGMLQKNKNLGDEFLIPDYNLSDAGAFIFGKKNFRKFDFSSGLRYDTRNIHSEELIISDTIHFFKFKEFYGVFSKVTGSIGGSYSFTDNFILKLNFSRGFRAPNISELTANGIHEGTFRYISGNSNLKPEISLQEDLGFVATSQHISFELNLFSNSIQNFIFLHKLSGANGSDSITVSEGNSYLNFTYSQGNANLSGGEIMMDIHPHPLDWLHFENSFSYVNGKLLGSNDSKYLPFIPAPKFSSDLRADLKKLAVGSRELAVKNSYFKIGMDNFLAQNRIFSAYNTETTTPSYALINLGVGTDVTMNNKTLFLIFFSVNNLTDVAYQSHLSRLKYAGENYVTGRTGVYNMGRNVSVKLVVPIG